MLGSAPVGSMIGSVLDSSIKLLLSGLSGTALEGSTIALALDSSALGSALDCSTVGSSLSVASVAQCTARHPMAR
jgi:hypothetical protein